MAIIKILSRARPAYMNLIRYIVKEGNGKQAEIFTQNLCSNDPNGWNTEFMVNESYRQRVRKDQNFMTHEIISFGAADKEKITPEVMADIARKYMELRGREGVMLGAVHRAEHVHLHFCVSALQYRTGTSFRIEKPDLQKLKHDLQEYHKTKYPEISHSMPEHGSRKPHLTDRKWWAAHKELRNVAKERISGVIRDCFARASTQKEFLGLLREQNLHYYERGGIPSGIEQDGMKFRFSRLLDAEQVRSLPADLTEEEKALAEIRSIREHRERDEPEEMDR